MIAALIAAATIVSAPTPAAGQFWQIGGTQSCATWLANEPNKQTGSHWILGYWTGLNSALGSATGHTTDTLGIIGEVEKACEEAPSESVIMAVSSVYMKMRAAHR